MSYGIKYDVGKQDSEWWLEVSTWKKVVEISCLDVDNFNCCSQNWTYSRDRFFQLFSGFKIIYWDLCDLFLLLAFKHKNSLFLGKIQLFWISIWISVNPAAGFQALHKESSRLVHWLHWSFEYCYYTKIFLFSKHSPNAIT